MIAKDSVYAINIRKAKLFHKQDMAPYIAPQNDIKNVPNIRDVIKSIFGQQESSLVKKYQEGGKANG